MDAIAQIRAIPDPIILMNRLTSIIIPTYGHCQDLLKPCIDSIINSTDLGQVEIIVVANGCTDGTENYLRSLGPIVRMLSFKNPLGFTRAINEGLKVVRGDFVVLLNNDVVLFDQPRHHWIKMLLAPFEKDSSVGITGPVKAFWDCGGTRRDFMAFWCVMIARNVFDNIGPLDEIFSPGMGEDADFSIKAQNAGFKLVRVPNDGSEEYGTGIKDQSFPIFHKGSGTFGDKDYSEVHARNKAILAQRYGSKKMSKAVSIIIPTYNNLNKYLRPCLDSVKRLTNLDDKEVVIVANGCKDGTEDYVKSLGEPFTFRLLTFPEPIGFARAANEGMKATNGEFVILLNDDTAILDQQWANILLDPMKADKAISLTSPVKYIWDCNGIKRQVAELWCAGIRRTALNKIGYLDESYNPGPGADFDFSIRLQQAGSKILQVPVDDPHNYGSGVTQTFPIFHVSSGTYGQKSHRGVAENLIRVSETYGPKDNLENIYKICLVHECDINRLFPKLRSLAEQCAHITEFGVRGVFSTYAFLAGRPSRYVGYDIEYCSNIEEARSESQKAGINFDFKVQNDLEADIEETDLLFIDTLHQGGQLRQELAKHANKVRKFILMHDTETYGVVDEKLGFPIAAQVTTSGPVTNRFLTNSSEGLQRAINEFLGLHPDWRLKEHIQYSNGLTILERIVPIQPSIETKKANPAISIIVPTCGKDWQNVLKKCLDAVFVNTDLQEKEVIVVANGAPKEALDWLKTKEVRIIEYSDRIGYVRAVNAGILASKAKYIILLDDDSWLQPQQYRDYWIDLLAEPFLKDKTVGVAGPFGNTYEDLGEVLHSGCTMYKRKILDEVGLFDEIYNPGYLSDEDLAIRIRKAGYRLAHVPEGGKNLYVNGVFQIDFPVVHLGTVNTMPKDAEDRPLVERNRKIILGRYGTKSAIDHMSDKVIRDIQAIEDKKFIESVLTTKVAVITDYKMDEPTFDTWYNS